MPVIYGSLPFLAMLEGECGGEIMGSCSTRGHKVKCHQSDLHSAVFSNFFGWTFWSSTCCLNFMLGEQQDLMHMPHFIDTQLIRAVKSFTLNSSRCVYLNPNIPTYM